jgi:prolyl oligopeptidase
MSGALTTSSQPTDPSRALHDLFEREWNWQLEQDPVRASLLGDRRWNDRWPDVGPAAAAARRAHLEQALTALGAVDRARLQGADRVSYDLFARECRVAIDEYRQNGHLLAFDQRAGIHTSHDLTNVLRFETEKDYRDWLARLRGFPAYVDGTIDLLREGVRARVLQPKVIVDRVIDQLDRQLAQSADDSAYLASFRAIDEAVAAGARDELARGARQVLASDVQPALKRLRTFLADEYRPAAYDRPGIWQAPNGEALYAFHVGKFTTTDLSPGAVHEKGVAEVARIRGEMQAILGKVGFKGDLPAFFTYLRTDPQFYYRAPAELLDAYRAIAKRIDPTLVRLFRTLPRAPYGVEPIPDLIAPDTTTAYYNEPAADGSRPGRFYVNLYKPEVRPRYEMMALSMHEAVPGHHLQIALAMELDLPAFRRYGGYTAFVEGWALYAESLGDELGLYDDPYAKFGQLTYEMWRAVRLVVDTGLHAMRWDRQKAIDYFMANAAKTEADVVNEIDRYIGWPGQALAYKIGELEIKALRRHAEDKLGPRFDVRAFHDVVLRNGAVTLDVLKAQVEEWIDQP